MFWQGYFYWCGIALNVIFAFWIVAGIALTVRYWRNEKRSKKRYAVKNLKE